LKKALGPNLVALFSPEHGLDGTIGAGKYVARRRDSATGLPVVSLYGPTRKPTSSMLKGIDVLVFDMQDLGARAATLASPRWRKAWRPLAKPVSNSSSSTGRIRWVVCARKDHRSKAVD
jgi:hypothetical protein